MRRLIVAALLTLAASQTAHAQMLSKSGTFAGTAVDYKVLLPPGYSLSKSYPVVLVFTGGGQSIQAAENTVLTDWKPETDKRGWIVVSPAAPGGQLFFQDGDKVFPAFLDMIRKDYRPIGKLHIAGHSNGGLSAFHIAAKYPSYFSTVTGYPGLWQDDPEANLPTSLKRLCLYMHVGDQDAEWRRAMEAEAHELAAAGFRIKISVEKSQAHRLKAAELDLPKRLVDEIESCR
jgi:poly(3-hydroxybutyrate) depolymerase